MIRQAHSYLVGAMSGAALIAAAIAVFVLLLLVSLQAFRDWPIPSLGGPGKSAPSIATKQSGSHAAATPGSTVGTPIARRARHRTGVAVRHGGVSAVPSPGSANAGSKPGPGSGSSSSSSLSGGAGGSGSTASNGSGGGSGSSPSSAAAGTVNDTVSQVDQTVLGGALQGSGVTGVTQGAVNGVAGPNSTAGQTIDKTAGAVGGLLGGHH